MKASEMIPRQRYKILDEVFVAIKKQENNYLCRHGKNQTLCVVSFDRDVIDIKLLSGKISKEDIEKFINYIKNSGYWYEEKKMYIKLLRSMVKYKINCIEQKVLARKPILEIENGKKYKNGYNVYRLDKFIEWFMKGEKNV